MKNSFATLAFVLPCLTLSVPSFASVIFDSGPTSGVNGYFIDGPNPGPYTQWIADQFNATGSGVLGELDVGLWVPTGATPTTFTWWLGTTYLDSSIGGGVANLTAPDYSFFSTNNFGYDVYNVHLTGLTSSMMNAGSTYWLTLGNANNSSGDQGVAWDENGGPASCNFGVGNTFNGSCGGNGSQAFTLSTNSGTVVDVPAPGSMALLVSGIFGLASSRRRKIKS